MRLNSQPSHLHARGVVIRVRRGDGVTVGSTSRVRRAGTPSCRQDVETRYESEKAPRTRKRVHRVLLARDDDVPVQQVRRPVRLAPRPRDEADGVVLAPAAPFLAEASFGDAGHFAGSPRSSRRCWWFAPRRAGWVLARERCGRCNCACCCFAGRSGSGADSAREFERAQYGRCGVTNLRLRNLDWSAVRRFWQ